MYAASQPADLSGTVRDSSGAVIPKASVTITKENTRFKQETLSQKEGFYRFAFLLPGSYTLTATAQGFDLLSQPSVKLDADQKARVDFTLLPATVKESVTVRGSASSVQTESPAVATEVDSELIRDLPANNRSFQTLIELAPGASFQPPFRFAGSSGGEPTSLNVNGQRDTANYFTVDGVSANVAMGSGPFGGGPLAGGVFPVFDTIGSTHGLISMDDMQEFKLQTSTYTAELGRADGGQLAIVSRSGSNEFHGSVFDYFRNEALDANDWFANAAGLPRAALRQNDFGGNFGGPILKNRTFFFFSYEGMRLRLPRPFATSVPSLTARGAATGAIQQLLNSGLPVDSQVIEDWWLDTGKKDDLLAANTTVLDSWCQRDIQGQVDAKSDVAGRVQLGAGSVVERSRIRGPVVIGKGCHISDSMIGPFTSIGDGSVIIRSIVQHAVLLDACRIEGVDRVEDSLIGRNAVVRSNGSRGALKLSLGDDSEVEL